MFDEFTPFSAPPRGYANESHDIVSMSKSSVCSFTEILLCETYCLGNSHVERIVCTLVNVDWECYSSWMSVLNLYENAHHATCVFVSRTFSQRRSFSGLKK